MFDLTVSPNNHFGVTPEEACPPAGTCSPAVADGYYVMLKPLAVGQHVIHIEATAANGFAVDITYQIKVTPVDLEGT